MGSHKQFVELSHRDSDITVFRIRWIQTRNSELRIRDKYFNTYYYIKIQRNFRNSLMVKPFNELPPIWQQMSGKVRICN